MKAKKKRAAKKTEQPAPKLTAIKLVVHRASDDHEGNPVPGIHRYVITGMLVSTEELSNFPKDFDGVLVFEDAEQGSFGFSLSSMVHQALSGMKTRESKCQGCSADQSLIRLREI